MRFYLMLGMFLFIVSCGSGNDDFDPFDNDYGFHNNMKLADYDTIWDTCGYWGLESRNKDGVTTEYYFFDDDIEGKGFSIAIDSVKVNFCDSLYFGDSDRLMVSFVTQHPIDVGSIEHRLRGLGVVDVAIVFDSSAVSFAKITDSKNQQHKGWLRAHCNSDGYAVRHLDYTNIKN